MDSFDLVVLGGGINGVAIACDAAGRGLSVCLCEQGDLACATSSWSTKLIHGGLRYLEQYEFGVVKKALKEREVLMAKAPFLIRPLEFILPYERQLRPAWMLRCGLWLYDTLAWGGSLPRSKRFSLHQQSYGDPLKVEFKTGFSYYDCQTDDARLVVLTARLAAQKGVDIRLHTACQQAERSRNGWMIQLKDFRSKESVTISSKAIVNATGPWVEHVAKEVMNSSVAASATLVQGSHFVIPRCYQGDHAYIFQSGDKRVFFAIPFHDDFTLIGTTDRVFSGDLKTPVMSDEESTYLLKEINRYFKQAISPEDIVWSYSGVRTLFGGEGESASKISRDYHLLMDRDSTQYPAVHVFGGKITTHRVLAEQVMKQLMPFFPKMTASWTETECLPGGDYLGLSEREAIDALKSSYGWLPDHIFKRYWESYGMDMRVILNGRHSLDDMGLEFGAGLYQCEIDYLTEHEWAQTIDDIIWRRSKLGLLLSPDEKQAIEEYLQTLK
ncbi:MAG: glycerol-3-phosphate dehydrogenase [Coxiellaceae bacterium]|nr:glycerol-3-phosphate dehydrogenase [Coxiellaceae bacterium]